MPRKTDPHRLLRKAIDLTGLTQRQFAPRVRPGCEESVAIGGAAVTSR
jgi:hypothetical protein